MNRILRVLLVGFAVCGHLTAGQCAIKNKEYDRMRSDEPIRGPYLATYERDVVAETLWLEARSEGKTGIDAVATVIMNRTNREIARGCDALRPEIMAAVCLKPNQFSCWNGMLSLKVASRLIAQKEFGNENERRIWDYCVETATKMVRGEFEVVGPYTHFYAMRMASAPSWSKDLRQTVRIGNHVFGRL